MKQIARMIGTFKSCSRPFKQMKIIRGDKFISMSTGLTHYAHGIGASRPLIGYVRISDPLDRFAPTPGEVRIESVNGQPYADCVRW